MCFCGNLQRLACRPVTQGRGDLPWISVAPPIGLGLRWSKGDHETCMYILALPSKLFTTLIMQQLSKSAIKTNECIAGYVKPQSTFQRRKNIFCMRIWMKKTAMNINDNWPMILQSCNPYIVGIFSAGLQCLVCSRDQCLVLQPWWMSTYIPLLHGTASSHIGLAYCALKYCKNVYVTNFHKFFT